eukprot:SAG22_NODE_1592_length_4045_cov_1.929802_1_plen_601_part_00
MRPLLLLLLVLGAVRGDGPAAAARPIIFADEHQGDSLRRVMAAVPEQQRASGVAVAVSPPPGIHGGPIAVQLSFGSGSPAWPYAAGLEPANQVGGRIPVVTSRRHWARPQDLPENFDVRSAFPTCRTMRAVQNQGACDGCYSFATVAALGDRICQATNGTVDAILSAEAPLFCANLGGCRGGNLGPVWDYLANVGVPSGCSPGQNLQPSGCDGHNSGVQPQSAASWAAQAAATAGGCCYPVARRTMESNNPTCLQQPCPGGTCPLRTRGGDAGIGQCVDWWGNKTSNSSLEWRHYRAIPNTTHGFASNTALMQAILSDGPIPTAIWLCAGDGKPANRSSPVFRGGLGAYKGGVYDCPHYGCGLSFHAVTLIGWGTDNRSGLKYWTARNSWGDNFGENHLRPGANCSRGQCGYFRITRDYVDPQTNASHWSCQMNWHAVAALPENPGSCSACVTRSAPHDTDYCKCYELSQHRQPRCAISGADCTSCCVSPPPPPPGAENDATLASIQLSVGTLVPPFSATNNFYTVDLGGTGAPSITINVTTTSPKANVTISGRATHALRQLLQAGVNQTASIVVTAADGVTTQANVLEIDDPTQSRGHG